MPQYMLVSESVGRSMSMGLSLHAKLCVSTGE